MPKVNPDVQTTARIKVIGVGGSGMNAINHMINHAVEGVEFIAMNADAQDLHQSLAEKKIHIGRNLTRGLGTGMDPEIGREAAEETKAEIQEVLKGTDMVFIACGMGGGTGTGASPVVARAAKEQGILTVAVVTKPFSFEGEQRERVADQGAEALRQEVDAIIIIPNDQLLAITDSDTSFRDAFALCDEVLRQAVESISELITTPGTINIDYADIRTIMSDAGSAFMGIGRATGENRAEEAAFTAINSPLLDMAISGARGVLFSISGSEDLKMFEVQTAAKIITESIDPNAKVIFGTIQDDKLKKGELKVTVIATGFDPSNTRRAQVRKQEQQDPAPLDEQYTPASTQAFAENNRREEKLERNQRQPDREIQREQEPAPRSREPEIVEEVTTENDWSTVPAFLRRARGGGNE